MTQRGTSFKYSLKFLVVCASIPYYRLHTYIVTSNPSLISVAVGLVHIIISYKMHSNSMQYYLSHIGDILSKDYHEYVIRKRTKRGMLQSQCMVRTSIQS